MGIVHASRGQLAPASDLLRSEVDIVAGVANAAMPSTHPLDWRGLAEDYDRVRDLIAQVVPGFENYNEKVRSRTGFVLPNGPRARRFTTPDGKAHFKVHGLPSLQLEADQLVMMTIRSHDQYNTTIYALNDRYRGIHGFRRVVLMHPEDMAARAIEADQRVDLVSHFQGQRRRAPSFTVVPYEIPRGCVATYFPEANVLVPLESFAAGSQTPTSKSVAVTVHQRAPA